MTGVEVTLTGGVGERSGIKPGDRILSINGHEIRDPIDYRYHEEGSTLRIKIEKKGGGIRNIEIKKEEGQGLGLDLARIDIKRCRNHCIFCFMDQMPEGLRRSLYIKDDDYRLSFLFGNYITLTNLTGA
ncbi:MAG TPA: PDZ domain-containing protein, partial [Nitrospiria bacterium]|nr:PDZ domain-containing protein [Nitrospiria bacterium]